MLGFLEFLSLFSAIIYLGIALIIYRGLRVKLPQIDSPRPKISILIAARNEADHLPDCLQSLAELNYPKELTEILVLNDRSTDNTPKIVQEYCAKYSHFNFHNITEDLHGLSGKMNVLNQAISICNGEIILVTDADCQVNPDWANSLVSYFTENTGLVGGVTLLAKDTPHESTFVILQALDWLFLQAIASGSASAGFPTSILGNNYGFRKTAYSQTGGFEKIGFSLTEDMALMQAIRKLRKWRIAYPLQPESLLFSQPVKSLRQLYHQRMRWIAGGKSAPWFGWVMMMAALCVHLFPLVFLLLSAPTVIIILSLILPIMADFYFILKPVVGSLGRLRMLRYFAFFELYYFLYTSIFAIMTLLPLPIKWKDRTY
jgi:cellulose synthase/poly-beta-1,6-N-acetylglucosamine synthase-like glycosyltransferase